MVPDPYSAAHNASQEDIALRNARGLATDVDARGSTRWCRCLHLWLAAGVVFAATGLLLVACGDGGTSTTSTSLSKLR